MSMARFFTNEYLQEKVDTNKTCIAIEGLDKYYSLECLSLEDTIEFVSNQNYDLIYLDAGKGFGSIIRMVFKKTN